MRRQNGWTLVEMVMAMALVAVLAALAVPALGHALARHRVLDADNAFTGALHYARTAAVRNGARVLVCPSQDGRTCLADTRWDRGWLVALDRDHDNQPDASPLLRGKGDPALRIVSTHGRTRLVFRASGGAPGGNVTFTLCQQRQMDSVRQLVMSNSGRLRPQRPSAADAAACAAL